MSGMRLVGLSTLAVGLTLANVARADDPEIDVTATATTDEDAENAQCIDECKANCKAGIRTGAAPSVAPQSQGQRVDVNVTPGIVDEQPTVEGVTPEERARAAEQFEAAMERMRADHRAELERVRAEERDLASRKYEADINATRDEERRRYEAEIKAREAAIAAEEDTAGPRLADTFVTPMGLYGTVGGGVNDFVERNAVGATGVGGAWEARLGIGTRSVLGVEAQYAGGLRDIDALGIGGDAFLMNNGVEGVARLNAPITAGEGKFLVEPYAFGGVGYSRYTVVNETSNTSDISDDDDIMTIPMGVGLQLGLSGVSIDLRGTYRHTAFTDMFGETTSSFDDTSLNNWGASAALGFEF